MYREHSVGVVVPAYNEEAFVGDVVRTLPAFVDTIFLVDDASTDGTWTEMGDVMRELEAGEGAVTDESLRWTEPSLDRRVGAADSLGRVVRVRHAENRGAGGAIKTGYLLALEHGVDVVATIDGDGQMDSAQLASILDPVVTGRAGYAKGDRFGGGNALEEMPPFRLVGNLLLTGLTRISSGYWRVSDPQNGFTAISRPALQAVDIESLWEYYGYMNQLLARLNTAGVDIADVPMPTTYGDEESTIAYGEYIPRVSLLLLVSFLVRLRSKYAAADTSPMVAGSVVGVLLGVNTLLKRLRQAVRRRGAGSSRGELLLGVGTVLAAVLYDTTREPAVVEESDGEEHDRTEPVVERRR